MDKIYTYDPPEPDAWRVTRSGSERTNAQRTSRRDIIGLWNKTTKDEFKSRLENTSDTREHLLEYLEADGASLKTVYRGEGREKEGHSRFDYIKRIWDNHKLFMKISAQIGANK